MPFYAPYAESQSHQRALRVESTRQRFGFAKVRPHEKEVAARQNETEEEENEGLDKSVHGESAYSLD